MNETEKYLIFAINAVLNEKPAPLPTQEVDPARLFSIASSHCVACLVFSALQKSNCLPAEIIGKFEKQYMKNFVQQTNRDYEVGLLFDYCNNEKIPIIPLKGWYLRHLYPDPYMRSSSDADIFARLEDFDSIRHFLSDIRGFQEEPESPQHIGFIKPPYVNIELHQSMTSHEVTDAVFTFSKPFSCSIPTDEGEFIYNLNPNNFYIYIITHMMKHFVHGGFGLRSVADVYLFNKKYNSELDREYIDRELELGKLNIAERRIRELADIWFGDAPADSELDDLADFITKSGVYGNVVNESAVSVAMQSGNMKKRKFDSFMTRVFPPLSAMRHYKKYLNGAGAVLLPFAWCARIISAAGRKRNWSRLKAIGNTDEAVLDNTEKLFSNLGLK